MIAAGFGCRTGCEARDLASALEQALASAGRVLSEVELLCAPEWKRGEPGLLDAARELGRPLWFLPLGALQAQSEAACTRSAQSLAHAGLPSVAETAALAGALALAAGTCVRLLGPRQIAGGAACALAAATGELSP